MVSNVSAPFSRIADCSFLRSYDPWPSLILFYCHHLTYAHTNTCILSLSLSLSGFYFWWGDDESLLSFDLVRFNRQGWGVCSIFLISDNSDTFDVERLSWLSYCGQPIVFLPSKAKTNNCVWRKANLSLHFLCHLFFLKYALIFFISSFLRVIWLIWEIIILFRFSLDYKDTTEE